MLKFGAVIVGLTLLAAIIGPALTPFDPARQELALRLATPSLAHPFGLDELGRDILARVLAGARISFLVGFTVVMVSSVFGTLLGAIAGYFGGRIDDLISRVIDTLLAFPGLLLAIALVAVLGPSLANVLVALTIIGWVGYARLYAGRCCVLASSSMCRRRRRSAPAPRAFSGGTSSRRRCPPWWCRPRSAWQAPSSAKHRSAFWASVCSRRRPAGGRC